MKFIVFVGTEGAMPAEALEYMNSNWPAYADELARRELWSVGRELDLPENGAATVRVRDGRPLVTNGPFAESKEFVAGFDLLECESRDEVVQIQALNPVARFHPLEIRPVLGELRLGPLTAAFAEFDDLAGRPYLLSTWVEGELADSLAGDAATADCESWCEDLERQGVYVLGGSLGGPETARTTRWDGSGIELSHGSFIEADAFISRIDVIRAGSRQDANEVAATHPLAARHAVEVRPFYSKSAPAEED